MARPKSQQEETVVESQPISSDVVVPKVEYDSLLARLEALEKNANTGKVPSVITKRVKERTARLKVIDDMYIVGFTKDKHGKPNISYRKSDNPRKGEEMYIEVILSDGTNIEKRELNFINDIGQNTKVVVVPILKTESIEHIDNYGTTKQSHVPEGGWEFKSTGREVALEVLRYQHISTIQLPNGIKIDVDNEFLNI